jgi:hypothetical protein
MLLQPRHSLGLVGGRVEAANAATGTGKIRQQLYSKSANLTRGNIVSSTLTVDLVTWLLQTKQIDRNC